VKIRIVFLETVGAIPVRERTARSVRETHALHLANVLQGGRCDATGNGKKCLEKLVNGRKCNEDSDCQSNKCKRRSGRGRRCE